MKKIVKLFAVMICLLLAISLASCGNIDEMVNEATVPLNEKIASLNGQIAELQEKLDGLEDENATLKSEKAALAAEKAALEKELEELKAEVEACDHAWIGENDPEYTWADDFSSCTATFLCVDCGEYAEEIAYQVEEDAKGNYIAYFHKVPGDTYLTALPTIAGISFNSDSTGYDEETNTFTVSEENPFILTVVGDNLSSVSAENDFVIYLSIEDIWYIFDWVFDTGLHSPVIEEEKIEYRFDLSRLQVIADSYGSINGIGLGDGQSGALIDCTVLDLNLAVGDTEDDVEFYTVTTAEELLEAFATYDHIRLGADIESPYGFDVSRSVTLDLAGYDLKVTSESNPSLWVYLNMTITNSSKEVSTIYKEMWAYADSTLSISGNVSIEASYHQINGDGFIDLTGYTGEELYIYTERLSGLVIPDGYAFYDSLNEMRSDEYKTDVIFDIYVRPIATEVATEAELVAALESGGHILFTADITAENMLHTTKDVFINMGGKSLTMVEGTYLTIDAKNAVVRNGTIEAFGSNSALKTYTENLLVDKCILISEEYFALYCSDGVVMVKNTVLRGGIDVSNAYTDTAMVYMLNNNLLNVGESFGICVSDNGVLVLSVDPTDMLNEYYNDGIVTDNGDGTYTVKVEK